MNSPATALIWEIWRKNRWGFALLLVLLAVCATLSFVEAYVKEKATVYDQKVRDLSGTLPLDEVWSISPTGLVARVFIRLDAGVVQHVLVSPILHAVESRDSFVKWPAFTAYDVFVSPTETLSWSDLQGTQNLATASRGTRYFRLSLGARKLFEGPVAPEATLSWTTAGGGKAGSRLLVPGLAQATAIEDAWRDSSLISLVLAWSEWGLPWSGVLLVFSVYVVFAIFGCTEPHAARGFTGIPPRRFALPVRTRTLVMWPIAFGCATLLLLFLAWSRLVLKPLLPAGVTMPEFYLVMLLLAGLAVFQALVWGLPSFPKTRAVLIILLVLGLSPFAVLSFSMPTAGGEWPERWSIWQPNLTQLFAVAWVGGVGAAWFGVRQERRGGWAGWQRTSRIADSIREWTPHSLEFFSPLHAQLWIEWRRNCRLQLGVWMLVVGIFLGVACLLGSSSGEFFFSGVGDAIDFLKTVGLVACVAVMGLNLARDGSSKRLALSSFTATRPIRTGDLLTAKLLAGVATWILAVSILAVAMVLAVAAVAPPSDQMWAEWNRMQNRGHILNLGTIVFVLAFALHVFCGILPLSLSGRIPGFPWSLLPLLLIYGGLLNAFDWFQRHNQWFGLLFILLVAAVVLKLLVAVWGFRRAIGLRLVSTGFVAFYVIFWLVGTGLLALLAFMYAGTAGFGFHGLRLMRALGAIFIPAAILVLPLARIALSPLALAMNRHR
ncbi:MAG: hypothetical protein ACYDH9_08605 [Limisphaerales bacterium]